MATPGLTVVPIDHRPRIASALAKAFSAGDVSAIHAVVGGASGALTYRVETRAGDHLLRAETISGPLRNPHQYGCMQTAADAGIAPPITYLDADDGVVVMPFLQQRPIADFPGGLEGAAAAMGELLARLHATATFPSRGDYLDNLDRLFGYLERSGRVAPGLLDRHREGFERLRAVYPWEPDTFTSAHNDPNQFNVLFDGDRLWLIDWETAYRNDPHIDVATACSHLAATPELRATLVRAWLGREADARTMATVVLAARLVQLYAGCILLVVVVDPGHPTHDDLTAMSLKEFQAGIEGGSLRAGEPGTTHAYAKILLGQFVQGLESPDVVDALQVVAVG
jgi:aminoglycoside phosphotransferase (APT) family kinase protein